MVMDFVCVFFFVFHFVGVSCFWWLVLGGSGHALYDWLCMVVEGL